jgi:hypothetical protein
VLISQNRGQNWFPQHTHSPESTIKKLEESSHTIKHCTGQIVRAGQEKCQVSVFSTDCVDMTAWTTPPTFGLWPPSQTRKNMSMEVNENSRWTSSQN